MHPDDEPTDDLTALLALPATTGEEEHLPRRADRRRSGSGRHRGLLSAIAPLVAMLTVAALWQTGTGPFAGAAEMVVTASIGTPRLPVSRPEPPPTPSPAPEPWQAETEVATVTAVEPALPAAPPAPPPGPQPYLVAAGDTIADAAAHCGLPWQRVFDANPGLADPGLVEPGQELRCPAAEEQLAQRPLPEDRPAPEQTEEEAAAEQPAVAEEEPEEEPTEADDAPAVPGGSVWDDLAECESGGDWHINTGNGYYGGLQFSASSWRAVGGSGLPHEHSREEQILRGEILQDAQGWGAWPSCASELGLI